MRPFDPSIIDAATRHLYHFHARSLTDRGSGGDDMYVVGSPTLDDNGVNCVNGVAFARTAYVVDLSSVSNLTIQAWTRFADVQAFAGSRYLYSWYLDANNYCNLRLLEAAATYPRIYGRAYFGGAGFSSTLTELTADQWAAATAEAGGHWAMTIKTNGASSEIKVYLNNVNIVSTSGTLAAIAAGNGQLDAGAYAGATSTCWEGWVDNLKVSDELAASFPLTRFTEGRRGVVRGPGLNYLAGAVA